MQAPRHSYMMHRWKWKSQSRVWENSQSKRSRKREERREKRDGAYLEGRHGREKCQAFKTIQPFGLATPHPTAASWQNERPMAKLRQIFEMTAGVDADALLSTPDLTYVVELLRDAGETLCVDDLQQLYAAESWKTDRSFTWLELEAGTAYVEEDITQPVDDSRVSFIGSLPLLLEAEAGARVHYEGQLVYGDPSPRELPSKGPSGSPEGNAGVAALTIRCLHVGAHNLRAPPSSVGFLARDFCLLQ